MTTATEQLRSVIPKQPMPGSLHVVPDPAPSKKTYRTLVAELPRVTRVKPSEKPISAYKPSQHIIGRLGVGLVFNPHRVDASGIIFTRPDACTLIEGVMRHAFAYPKEILGGIDVPEVRNERGMAIAGSRMTSGDFAFAPDKPTVIPFIAAFMVAEAAENYSLYGEPDSSWMSSVQTPENMQPFTIDDLATLATRLDMRKKDILTKDYSLVAFKNDARVEPPAITSEPAYGGHMIGDVKIK